MHTGIVQFTPVRERRATSNAHNLADGHSALPAAWDLHDPGPPHKTSMGQLWGIQGLPRHHGSDTASWVRNITAPPRDQMHMAMRDGLSGHRPAVHADVEALNVPIRGDNLV